MSSKKWNGDVAANWAPVLVYFKWMRQTGSSNTIITNMYLKIEIYMYLIIIDLIKKVQFIILISLKLRQCKCN